MPKRILHSRQDKNENENRFRAYALTCAYGGWRHLDDGAAGSHGSVVPPHRPQGPCDIYASAGDPCVAAHSTTRALYATYNGPLYQVLRQSDGKTLDIRVVQPTASPVPDPGGYADAAAQDRFCAGTYCWISIIYDQSPKHNDLTQAPRGGFSGPALGGFNNLPIADMAPITIMGHKVYGVFIEPGMGLRHNDAKGTAVDDQAEGQYWVVNGKHFNAGCCFDYGNAEIDSRDDDNGTMETLYFGNATPWYSGNGNGPWIMTDQENNLVGCVNQDGSKGCPNLPSIPWRFVTAIGKGEPHHWASLGGDAQKGALSVMFDGMRVNPTYDPMRKQGAILLGNGGDNSDGSQGTFYEGAMTAAGTFPSNATDQLVQANIVAAGYGVTPLTVSSVAAASTSGVAGRGAGGGADVHSGVFAGHHSNVHEYDRSACSGRFVEHCCTQQSVDLCRFRHNRDIKDVRSAGRTGCERERDLQSHFRASSLQRRSRRQCIMDEPGQRQKASRDSG